MTLKNSPEGSNYIDIAAVEVPGANGVNAPTVLQVTFASAPNRLSLNVGRRSSGTLANIRSIYTPGDTLTFATVGVTDSVSWVESTNPSDKTGRFELFALVRDHAGIAGRFACRAERQIGATVVTGRTVRPVISVLGGASASAATISTRLSIPAVTVAGTNRSVSVPVATVAARISIPAPTLVTLSNPYPATILTRATITAPNVGNSNPRPVTIATTVGIGVPVHEAAFTLVPLGAFTIPVGSTAWTWRFVAWRDAGLEPVEVQHLLVVPIDESYVAIEWTAASDISASAVRTFTIDSIAGEAYWGTYGDEQPGGTITLRGTLTLKPHAAQRLVIQAAADTAWPATTLPRIVADVFAPSSPIDLKVRARYRGIR